jgi:hypothetical protein
MSNIKKARYTGAPKLLNQKLSVIKVSILYYICIFYVPFVPITLIRILLLIEIFLLSGFDKGTFISLNRCK